MKIDFTDSKSKKYFSATNFSLKIFCIGIFFSIFVNSTQFFCLLFCNDFIFNINNSSGNFFTFLKKNLLDDKVFDVVRFYLILFTHIFIYMMNMFSCAFLFSILFNFVEIDKWKEICFKKHSTIINSVNSKKFSDKVALVVGVCNDFSPNQLLQTANQTYKNMDVWICDDSTNQNIISEIDHFVKQHKNFYVSRRDHAHKLQHPTKVGNTFYWLNKYGKKYDFVFENDSSSIVTPTFVENSLCYFHSPYLKNMKISGITCNGNFYPAKNFISHINSFDWLVGNEFWAQSIGLLGTRVSLDGWCTFYKVQTLLSIPLEKIECASCDSARGFWLHQKGYVSIFNPFDFGGKIGVQNIEAYKKQRLKWMGAEYCLFKKRLLLNKKNNLYVNCYQFNNIFVLCMISIVANFFNAMLMSTLPKQFLPNMSSMLITLIPFILFGLTILIPCVLKRFNLIKILWVSILLSMLQLSILYKRMWQLLVRGFLLKTNFNSKFVVDKNLSKSSFSKKIRASLHDSFFVLLITLIFLSLTFLVGSWDGGKSTFFNLPCIINNWYLWFFAFPIVVLPSCFYVFFVWIGELRLKNGYSNNDKNFDIKKFDFRYKEFVSYFEANKIH